MYKIDIVNDVSKIIDYLKVGSLHDVTSYIWCGNGYISNIYIGGRIEIEKT